MRTQIKLFCAVMLVGVLAVAAFAQNAKPARNGPAPKPAKTTAKFMGKGDGVTTCPVTGEEIAGKDVKGTFYGREVFFCCGGCLAQAQKAPAKYLKKTHEAQLAATKNLPPSEGHGHAAKTEAKGHGEHGEHPAAGETKFLGKGDGLETCPVTGEAVNKNLQGEADGQTFYVCCEGCLDTVKKNPAAYLKKK